jgi:hypothetical protein
MLAQGLTASPFDTGSLWFEVSVVLGIFAVGNILFGHFEAHRPPWRRLLKVAVFLVVIPGVSATLGRAWAFGLLTLPLLAAVYVHGWWLPKHGVNGLTGEPRERYLELLEQRGTKVRSPGA